jgi:uncharacterized protein YbjT (DUF2867 family)
MRIILAGATGLIGGRVLECLLARDDVTNVTTVSRRALPEVTSRQDQFVSPAPEWSAHIADRNCDVAVCCLGTTIKAAGSQTAFAALDHAAVVAFASACHSAGARQLMLVTSVGADAGSRNFYLSTKGKAEADVRDLGFARIDIFRPGLLTGQRAGPLRIGERLANAVSPLTDILTPNVLSRYRSIPAARVAHAISGIAGAQEAGEFVHHNDDMRSLSSKMDEKPPGWQEDQVSDLIN